VSLMWRLGDMEAHVCIVSCDGGAVA